MGRYVIQINRQWVDRYRTTQQPQQQERFQEESELINTIRPATRPKNKLAYLKKALLNQSYVVTKIGFFYSAESKTTHQFAC